jgi:MGT family glycosyltransferase
VVGPAWDRLRADHGLPPDPGGVALGGTVALVPAPRSFRDPSRGWGSSRHAVRPPILDEVVRHPPGDRPFVYATLGTVFNVESGDLLARLADALGRLDADALLTIGPGIDPAELGDVAPNVRVAPFVPQRDVLGRCDAVVCHGGSGTLVAALSLGVPVVVLPMGADQPDNADRCEELGVGASLDPVTADAAEIARAVAAVLGDPGVRDAASRLADEAAAQPPLDRLPALLELV